jgi:hypothetical protein
MEHGGGSPLQRHLLATPRGTARPEAPAGCRHGIRGPSAPVAPCSDAGRRSAEAAREIKTLIGASSEQGSGVSQVGPAVSALDQATRRRRPAFKSASAQSIPTPCSGTSRPSS